MTTVSEYYTATTPITSATIASKQFEMEVKEGLIHLDDLWPRMISTHATKGAPRRQEILVFDALDRNTYYMSHHGFKSDEGRMNQVQLQLSNIIVSSILGVRFRGS